VTNVWLGGIVNGEGLTGAVKWADIVYEIDNQSVLYHLLHNVVDGYLKYFRQDAMKISLAVQRMSSIVAAAIDTHVTTGKEKCFKSFII
jgi:membrane-bound lytic murein transglycosylase MltF